MCDLVGRVSYTTRFRDLPALRTVFCQELGLAPAALESWVGFWLALQDLGKFADFFQSQCPDDVALAASGVLPGHAVAARPFGELFTHITTPSPLQRWAAVAPLAAGPQIHLLEDVTGAGKTEAAVMLTHRLLAGGHADGFFIALPTMVTANAMYGRIAEVCARLFVGPASLVLAHGQSFLVDGFAHSVLPDGPPQPSSRFGARPDDVAFAVT